MKILRTIIIGLMVAMLTTGCEHNISFKDIEPIPTPDTDTAMTTETEQPLLILSEPEKYTYDNLVSDIDILQQRYGDIVNVTKLCETADGRYVYDLVIGDSQGENQILIFGAMHAREYITSQVVMRQLYECIKALNNCGEDYNGISKKELLDGVTIHFIPMSNPDGVSISQFGLDGIQNESVKNSVINMNCNDYTQWKSNAEGVDLNRNFDAGWEEFIGSAYPSSDRYKGTSPGSAEEASALIKLTQDCKFKRTISYHTCGAQIYWYYLQSGSVLDESRKFAEQISNETKYPLDSDYTSVDAAGYKDWAVYKMGIPSITIEVGNESGQGIINPVPISSFEKIWDRNKNVVFATLCNLKNI